MSKTPKCSTILAILASALLAWSVPASADDEVMDDWPGRYEGRRDGRAVTLVVRETERSGKRQTLEFTLSSEDGPTFVGTGRTRANNRVHRVSDVTLRETGGGDGKINLRRVFIHNFDRRFITEEHKWNGTRFGGAFGPEGFGESDRGPGLDDDPCRWTGHYRVNNDGRQNAVLKVTSTERDGRDIVLDFTWTYDDGTTLRDTRRTHDHRINDMRLESAGGDSGKRLDRLYLHTWDTDFMSAVVRWRGRSFGTSFKDTGDLAALLPGCAASSEHYDRVFGATDRLSSEDLPGDASSPGRVDLDCRTVRRGREASCRYDDPVVVFGPVSTFGSDPVHVRVSGVSPTHANAFMEEWSYLDGSHDAEERVDFVTVEAGEHEFPSGQKVKAGYLAGIDHRWSSVEFDSPFSEKPIVLPQVVSVRGTDPVVPRLKNITKRGFEIRLQEEEGGDETHRSERVAVIAVEPGRTVTGEYDRDGSMGRVEVDRIELDHRQKRVTIPELLRGGKFIAAVQTSRGADPVHLRTGSGRVPGEVKVRLEEEQSVDEETEHRHAETVGYLVALGDWAPTPLESEARSHFRKAEEEEPEPESVRQSLWEVVCLCRDATGLAEFTIETCAVAPDQGPHLTGLSLQCGLFAPYVEARTGFKTSCVLVSGTDELVEEGGCPIAPPGSSAGFHSFVCPGRC